MGRRRTTQPGRGSGAGWWRAGACGTLPFCAKGGADRIMAEPRACPAVMPGGIDRSSRSVTTTMGKLPALASAPHSAPDRSLEFAPGARGPEPPSACCLRGEAFRRSAGSHPGVFQGPAGQQPEAQDAGFISWWAVRDHAIRQVDALRVGPRARAGRVCARNPSAGR